MQIYAQYPGFMCLTVQSDAMVSGRHWFHPMAVDGNYPVPDDGIFIAGAGGQRGRILIINYWHDLFVEIA